MLDQFRELRFLMPPFFFFAFVTWGAYLDPTCSFVVRLLTLKDVQTIVIAGVGATTIPLGFLIGVVSMILMAAVSRITRWQQWDVPHSDSVVNAMWAALDLPRNRKFDLQAVSTFDRVKVPKEVLDWLVRRWTAFLVSINSIVSLLLAWLAAKFLLGIHLHCRWYSAAGLVCALLLANATVAWKETRGMGKFQTALTNIGNTPRFE